MAVSGPNVTTAQLPRAYTIKDPALEGRLESVDEMLRACATSPFNDIVLMSGLEIRAAYLCLERPQSLPLGALTTPARDLQQPSLRKYLLRPAQEIITYSFISPGQEVNTLECAAKLAACLTGSPTSVRRTPARTRPDVDGHYFVFPQADDLATGWRARSSRHDHDHPPVWSAIQRFLDANILHPFEHGNGRTARALLYADLIRLYDLPASFSLPLGVVHTANAKRGMAAFATLYRTGDASEVVKLMADELADSITIADATARTIFSKEPAGRSNVIDRKSRD